MLKSWDELYNLDISKFVQKRDGASYLPWPSCMKLLHDNGAKTVWFEPCVNSNGSSLFMSDQVYTDKNKVTNRCYEVRVKIVIDDLVFEAQYPLMNGSNPVKDNSMSQQRVWNAQTRAFVKGVAMRTGLGFSLWMKEDIDTGSEDDLSKHSLYAIRDRMQQQCTALVKKGITTAEIAKTLNVQEQALLQYYLGGIFDELHRIETEMAKL